MKRIRIADGHATLTYGGARGLDTITVNGLDCPEVAEAISDCDILEIELWPSGKVVQAFATSFARGTALVREVEFKVCG